MTLTVVGVGRIGGMMAGLGRGAGWAVQEVGRTGPAAEVGGQGPVVVCTRNDDLEEVLARTPPDRRGDLVFVQNGVLAPWLRARGLETRTVAPGRTAAPAHTQTTIGVLYVAVDRPGARPVPGAASIFAGPHAATVAGLLDSGGVTAREARDELDLRQEVGTKLAWICVLGVLGEALAATVGQVLEAHEGDVGALCEELAPALAAGPDTAAAPDLVARVLAYSRSVAHYRTAVKEWPWRTGWLLAQAATAGVDLPLHRRWLERAGHGARLHDLSGGRTR